MSTPTISPPAPAPADAPDTRRRGIGGHHRGFRGKSDVWLTPPEIVAALGPFDLDPCGCIGPWSCADVKYVALQDGLAQQWHGRVWLNPPYGPELGKWLARLADHGNGIAIAFARTETRAFFDHVWPKASGLLFIRGRLHFYRPDGTRAKANAGAPSVLIAYGSANAARLRHCGIPGHFVPLNADAPDSYVCCGIVLPIERPCPACGDAPDAPEVTE